MKKEKKKPRKLALTVLDKLVLFNQKHL